MDGLFQAGDMHALKRGLEAAWRTHQEVSQNLANVDTPGYVSKKTDFRTYLVGGPGHEALPPPGEGLDFFLEEQGRRIPGVNVEEEMARLSQTSLEQAALVQLLSSRYQGLLTAIREGR